MSIAILKKKTFNGNNSRVNPISGVTTNNNLGFNINGVLRNGPSVGGPILAPSFVSNNRGSCLKNTCTYDSKYIKTSVKNTRGMLASRRICNSNLPSNKCRTPQNWVQPISSSSNLQNSQSQYISRKRESIFGYHNPASIYIELTNKVAHELLSSRFSGQNINLNTYLQNLSGNCASLNGNCEFNSLTNLRVGSRNLPQRKLKSRAGNIVNNFRTSALSSSDYTKTLYLSRQCIPIPMALSSIEQVRNKISWPGIVNNSSCAKQYSNKEEYDADTITNKDCSNVENFLQGRLNSDFIENELFFRVSDENNILFKKALIPFLKPDNVSKLSSA